MLGVMMPLLFGLGREGRIFEVVAIVFAIGVFTVFLMEAAHPQLRFKKPLPAAEIRLNLAENEH